MFDKLQGFTPENTFFIFDFDHTMTCKSSASSYSLFRRSGLLGEDFERKNEELYSYYHPFEIDHTLSQKERGKLMFEWHFGAFQVLQESGFTQEMFSKVLDFSGLIEFRKGVKEFLKTSNELQIPIVILSAGIKQVIEKFLEKEGALYDNIYIQTNSMLFDERGVFIGVPQQGFIYPTEKTWDKVDEVVKAIVAERKNFILMGDMIDDVTMAPLDEEYTGFLVGILNRDSIDTKLAYESIFDVTLCDEFSDGGILEEVLIHLQK